MRFTTGAAAAALCGLASCASPPEEAPVFIFDRKPDAAQSWTPAPRIAREVAGTILLRRTAKDAHARGLYDLPRSIDPEAALGHIATFGKTVPPLFVESEAAEPSQLVLMFEGMTPEGAVPLVTALSAYKKKPAFIVPETPSALANNRLLAALSAAGAHVPSPSKCDPVAAVNPSDPACWAGSATVVKYDVRKQPEAVQSLVESLGRLNEFVSKGDLEATVVLMAESSGTSLFDSWSGQMHAGSDLRRREELVMTEDDADVMAKADSAPAFSPAAEPFAFAAAAKKSKTIPACFTSESSCMTQTNNCSGHGACTNKYGRSGGNENPPAGVAAKAAPCFVCTCAATVLQTGDEPKAVGRKTQHWGGNMCHKKDVSVPFWLLTGFTVTLVAAVGFAISLLFAVGEEKLPGVIGAGVSRSK